MGSRNLNVNIIPNKIVVVDNRLPVVKIIPVFKVDDKRGWGVEV